VYVPSLSDPHPSSLFVHTPPTYHRARALQSERTCALTVSKALQLEKCTFHHAVTFDTVLRSCTGCLKLQVAFCKRAINYRVLLLKETYEDKASYASRPPCIVHLHCRSRFTHTSTSRIAIQLGWHSHISLTSSLMINYTSLTYRHHVL